MAVGGCYLPPAASLPLHLIMNTYIHFTTPERAASILADNRLLMRPPHAKFGIDAVCAVDVRGSFVPGVQLCKRAPSELVAIIFTTSTPPDYTYPEEAVWHEDVVFSSASIIPTDMAIPLFHHTITDD